MLKVFKGPMFSQKTETMKIESQRELVNGNVLFIKVTLKNTKTFKKEKTHKRYKGKNEITYREVGKEFNLCDLYVEGRIDEYSSVFVDEFQFLEKYPENIGSSQTNY